MKFSTFLQAFFITAFLGGAHLTHAATCEYLNNSDWNSGFTSSIRITNNGTSPINGWQVSINYPSGYSITQIWNATLSGSGPYTAGNVGHNQTIPPGGQIDFGFNGAKTSGGPHQTPELGDICSLDVPPVNQASSARIDASSVSGTAPLAVEFSASASSDPDGDALSFTWTLPDGSTSNAENVQWTFTVAGNFPVSLQVSDGELLSELATLTVNVSEVSNALAYSLDPSNSTLFFTTTKKEHILETHTFSSLSGAITAEGEATFTIALGSVDSGIAIRDQRMRDVLFETALFATANARAQVNLDELNNLAIGASQVLVTDIELSLHGLAQNLQVPLRVTRLNAAEILVQSIGPILIRAEDFELESGVEALRNLASLNVISYAVPVNLSLRFVAQ